MKRRVNEPVFGEKGTKLIEYTGETPAVFGPFVVKKTYRFRQGKNPRLVDVRDLTLLTKAAGRKNLRDVSAEKKKEKVRLEGPPPKRVKEPKPEPIEAPAEIKEVDNGA